MSFAHSGTHMTKGKTMRIPRSWLVSVLCVAWGCSSEQGGEGQSTKEDVAAKVKAVAAAPGAAPTGLACLNNWRTSGPCGQWCLRETQADRAQCRLYLDCYYNNNCGPSTCGRQDDVCGVNRLGWGMAPKIIADQVYQCLGCPGSMPVTSCNGLPDTTPCTDGNACTTGERCRGNICRDGAPKVCTPLDQCHNAGTCNPGTGNCSNPVKTNGTPCNDGNACTSPDQCQVGICQGTPILGAPSGLTATAGSGQVQLTWSPAAGASAYNVKRATTPGGPYTTVATTSTPTFLDAHRAIGPTYYYIVTAVAACGESAPTNEASATPFSSKTGTFPPGPGPCKGPVSAPAPAAPQVSSATGGEKAPATDIAGQRGTGPKQLRSTPADKAAATGQKYARVQYKIEQVAGRPQITPTVAKVMEGKLVPQPALSNRILVVGKSGSAARFVTTVADPRVRFAGPNASGVINGRVRDSGEGTVAFNLPGAFLSADLLQQMTFELYTMPESVPAKTPVTIEALPALSSGATLIAVSSGTALAQLLFPATK